MDNETLILALRLGVVLILYLFLLALFVITQQELHKESQVRAAVATPGGRLIVVHPGSSGQAPGRSISLAPVTRLGRAADNNVVLDDDFVSGLHAMVVLKNGRWWVRDEGSTNGTMLNGQPVQSEMELSDGDELQIGQIRMRVAQ